MEHMLLPLNLLFYCKKLHSWKSFMEHSFIRYSHYALNCIGYCPHWSTFIRYTAFIPLYPLGAAGEVWLMYHALPYIKEKDLYRDFFSRFHFSYYTFIQILLLCYPLLWGKLYLHLLKQRRSKLGKAHVKRRE
uniref:Very-long-chain (3R)-3-hydroxyacyl-CoA dehydratase n=1 Tax=Opuntia streptacantha TaxID=393608 RepID=A0A7C8ZKK8_OPUST